MVLAAFENTGIGGGAFGGFGGTPAVDPYAAIRALGSQFNDDGSGYRVTKDGRKIKLYGPSLNDVPLAQSSYGLPIVISFGNRRLKGNLIWTSVIQEYIDENEKQVPVSSITGVMGNPSVEAEIHTYTFYYSADLIYSLGVVDPSEADKVVAQIYANKQLIYDFGSPDVEAGALSLSPKKVFRGLKFELHPGTEDQDPDSVMVAYENQRYLETHGVAAPVNIISANRGQATIRFTKFPLGITNNTPPDIEVVLADSADLQDFNDDYTDIDTSPIITTNLGMGADWNTGTLYCQIDNILYHIDMNTNAVTQTVSLIPFYDHLSGQQYLGYDNFIYSELTGKGYATANTDDGTTSGVIELDLFTGAGIRLVCHITIQFAGPIWHTDIRKIWSCCYRDVDGQLKDFIVISENTAGMNIFTEFNTLAPIYINTLDIDYQIVPGIVSQEPSFYWLKESDNQIWQGTPNAVGFYYDPPSGLTLKAILYHPTYAVLIVFMDDFTDGTVVALDANTDIVWQLDYAGTVFNPYNSEYSYLWASDLTGTNIVFPNGGKFIEINVELGLKVKARALVSDTDLVIPSANYQSIFGLQNPAYYDRATLHRTNLKAFIEFAGNLALPDPSQLEVQDTLADILIDGAYIADAGVTFRLLLDNLREGFLLTTRERDNVLQVNKRAASSPANDFALTDNDLLMIDTTAKVTLSVSRSADDDLSSRLNYTFVDYIRDFELNNVMVQRSSEPNPSSFSKIERSVAVPIIMRFSEAKTWALTLLYAEWATRNFFNTLTLPEMYSLEPGDAGTITVAGVTYTVEIVKVIYNADFSLTVQAKSYQTDYPISVVADPPQGDRQTLEMIAFTQPYGLDIASVYPTDAEYYIGAGDYGLLTVFGNPTTGGKWPGGRLYYLADTPQYIGTITGSNSPKVGLMIGTLDPPLAGREWSTDEINELTARFIDQSFVPTTVTDADWLTGKFNNLIVGNDAGTIEIIIAKTVVNNMDGTFTFSDFMRGRSGTNDNYDHPGACRVIFYKGEVLREGIPPEKKGENVTIAGVNVTGFADVYPKTSTVNFTGRSAKPFSPWDVHATDDGADNLVITWIRRTRAPDIWPDVGDEDLPLWEKYEKYSVVFYSIITWNETHEYDEANPSELGRQTFDDLTTGNGVDDAMTCTLDAATRTTVLGSSSMPDIVYLDLAQISDKWGRGIPFKAVLNVE